LLLNVHPRTLAQSPAAKGGHEQWLHHLHILECALLTDKQHPAMKRAVTSLKAKGETTFLCLSNSNQVYIATILEVSHGVAAVVPPASFQSERSWRNASLTLCPEARPLQPFRPGHHQPLALGR
jgi:hypothetical protein